MKSSIRKARNNQLKQFNTRMKRRYSGLNDLYFVTIQKHNEYLDIDINDIDKLRQELNELKSFIAKIARNYKSYCFGLHYYNYKNESEKYQEDRTSYFPHCHGVVYIGDKNLKLGEQFIGDFKVHIENLRSIAASLSYITKQCQLCPIPKLRSYWASIDNNELMP